LGERIRVSDHDLLQELNLDYDDEREREDDDDILYLEPEMKRETEAGSSKGKDKEVITPPKKYQEKPEPVEKPEISAENEKILKDYRKELKELGKSNNYDDFINSQFNDLYREECDKLSELRHRKNQLGTDQIQKTYDLGRPDLAILWRKQLYFIIDYQYVNNYKMYA